MKHLILILPLILLAGCSSQPHHYNDGISKSPLVLTLYSNGNYFLRHEGTAPYPNPDEHGYWSKINNESLDGAFSYEVVALIPRDDAKPARFARINEEPSLLGNLTLFDDLRAAFFEPAKFSLEQLDKQITDEAAKNSVQGIYER